MKPTVKLVKEVKLMILDNLCYLYPEDFLEHVEVDRDALLVRQIEGKNYYLFDKKFKNKEGLEHLISVAETEHLAINLKKSSGEIIKHEQLPYVTGMLQPPIFTIWNNYLTCLNTNPIGCSLTLLSNLQETPDDELLNSLLAHLVYLSKPKFKYGNYRRPKLTIHTHHLPDNREGFLSPSETALARTILHSDLTTHPTVDYVGMDLPKKEGEKPAFFFRFKIDFDSPIPQPILQKAEQTFKALNTMLNKPPLGKPLIVLCSEPIMSIGISTVLLDISELKWLYYYWEIINNIFKANLPPLPENIVPKPIPEEREKAYLKLKFYAMAV